VGNYGREKDRYRREEECHARKPQRTPAVADAPVPGTGRGLEDIREKGTCNDSEDPEDEECAGGAVKEACTVCVHQEQYDTDDEMHTPVHGCSLHRQIFRAGIGAGESGILRCPLQFYDLS